MSIAQLVSAGVPGAEDWSSEDEWVPRFRVGEWIDKGFDWLEKHFEFLFEWIRLRIDDLIDFIAARLTTADDFFGFVPGEIWLVLVLAVIAIVAFGRRNFPLLGATVVVAVVAIAIGADHWPMMVAATFALIAWAVKDVILGLVSLVLMAFIISVDQWANAMESLAMVLTAVAIALVIGIPLGVLAAMFDGVSKVVRPILDLMQTMPAMVWLLPVLFLFSLSSTAGVVATIIFCLPPGVRLAELGIRQVDPEVVEAGQAFGGSRGQILGGIQLPLATPTIMAGVNQVIMLALSMVVIAGLVGAGGLGGQVTSAMSTVDIALGFEAGLSVVALAIYLDRVTAALSDPGARTKRSRRGGGRTPVVTDGGDGPSEPTTDPARSDESAATTQAEALTPAGRSTTGSATTETPREPEPALKPSDPKRSNRDH